MPVGALASIGHRISGVILAVGVPAALYLLAMSLRGEESFADALALARSVPAKSAAVLMAWALAHHVLAGLRHMCTDFSIGSPLRTARITAYLVNYGAFAVMVVAAVGLW